MRIWHVGGSVSGERVSGIANTARLLARYQRRDHEVVGVGHSTGAEDGRQATATSPREEYIPTRPVTLPKRLASLLRDEPPDIVHFHSVFVPSHARVAFALRRSGIPYVIKLGGGLDPHMLSRGHHIGKRLYSTAVQRRFLHGAAAIILVTESEREDLETYLPGYDGLVEVIANPVDSETLTTPWKPREGTRRAVFLGRFDPAHKGLDRIVYYATALPDTQFDCYGSGDRNRRVFEQLQESAPPNVSFHEPIFGTDKNDVLSLATIYLHPARWEAFGISIAEAMWAGVPCAVGADIALAPLIRQRELGVVLSRDNARAAEQLRGYVRDRERLAAVSARGKDYAHRHFDPAHVAQRYESMYRSCLSSGASSTS